MSEIKPFKRSNVYYIVLTGAFMALILLSKFIFDYIKVLNGFSFEIYLIFFIYALIVIDDKKYAFTLLILTPWLLLICPFAAVNVYDFLLEYILVLYLFFPFIFFLDFCKLLTAKITNNKKRWLIYYLMFFIFSFTIMSLKLIVHLICGYYWWAIGSWLASFIFNLQIIGFSYLIILPVGLLTFKPIVCFIQK